MMRWALALLVLLAASVIPAVAVAGCTFVGWATTNECTDQESAYALAVEAKARVESQGGSASIVGTFNYYDGTTKKYWSRYTLSPNTGFGAKWLHANSCPAGSTWDPEAGICYSEQRCLAQPPLGFTKVTAASSWDGVCSGGCQYTQNTALDIQFLDESTGQWVGYTTGWKPSGQACAAGEPAPQPVTEPQDCAPAADGQTFCVKPSGDHCYSASAGRQICWKPGETGEKTDGSTLQVRNAGETPTPPTTPPPPGESFQQEGDSVTKAAQVNGQTVTTTTTNYNTVNGTNAGGSDSGEPGDGSGGEGEGGGTVGDGLGDFYEGEGDTLDSVWGSFKGRMQGAPIVSASGSFLTFSGTASCPTWTVPETAFWPEMTATWLCTGALADAMAFAGWLVLAGWAYLAFKIAVY